MLYRHLTLDQRYQIAYLFSGHISKKSIAETIGCHPSTVTRELQRNRTDKPYAGSIAHGQAKQRRRSASSRPHVSDYIYRHMVERLTAKQSPDQISGRLELLGGETVSRTTVYRYAWHWICVITCAIPNDAAVSASVGPSAFPSTDPSMIDRPKWLHAVALATGKPTRCARPVVRAYWSP